MQVFTSRQEESTPHPLLNCRGLAAPHLPGVPALRSGHLFNITQQRVARPQPRLPAFRLPAPRWGSHTAGFPQAFHTTSLHAYEMRY